MPDTHELHYYCCSFSCFLLFVCLYFLFLNCEHISSTDFVLFPYMYIDASLFKKFLFFLCVSCCLFLCDSLSNFTRGKNERNLHIITQKESVLSFYFVFLTSHLSYFIFCLTHIHIYEKVSLKNKSY